jgi:hypothetical protein
MHEMENRAKIFFCSHLDKKSGKLKNTEHQ